MVGFRMSDWDDAYENSRYILDGEQIIASWPNAAQRYRELADCELDVVCGEYDGSCYDLFKPSGKPKGMFVFVHGGYWQETDKSMWSHLAQGAVDSGWAAVLPGYDLCPEVGIADIISMVAEAINHAASEIDGPIVLTGHSAGGHIAAYMCTEDMPLSSGVFDRLIHVVSISGLADLRPLLNTKLNDALKLNLPEAKALSPALKRPLPNTRLIAWVGADERPEFLRQNRMLSDIWRGLGAWTKAVEEPGKNHFSVLDGLMDRNSPLMKTIFSDA